MSKETHTPPELVIFRGLPASGKTTAAKTWVASDPAHRARVNRDDLRSMLHDGTYLGRETETQIVHARNTLIRNLLSKGISVASDDTNLPQKTARDLAEQGALFGATVRVRDFTDVDVELCILRDLARAEKGGRAVGETVIREMYERYLKGRPTPLPPVEVRAPAEVVPYVPRPGSPKAIMVDLDGTLCLHNGRSPYDESKVGEDLPNRAVVEAVRAAKAAGYEILFCSGRTDSCHAETTDWLFEHVGAAVVWGETLLMRKTGDVRKDSIVKRELFDAKIRDDYDVVYVLDDRRQVVDAWRDLGLTVFQVAPGDF